MARYRGKARPLAGGTDLLVNMKKKVLSPLHLVSLGRIPELSRLERSNGTLTIGAGVTGAVGFFATAGGVCTVGGVSSTGAMLFFSTGATARLVMVRVTGVIRCFTE